MGFWDKLKTIVGGDGGGSVPPPGDDLARRVEAIVVCRMTKKEAFEAIVVADEAISDPAERTVKGIAAACAVVARLHDDGSMAPLGYVRTKLADGNWLYHPRGYAVASYGAAAASSTRSATSRPAAAAQAPAPSAAARPVQQGARPQAPPRPRDPYAAPDGI